MKELDATNSWESAVEIEAAMIALNIAPGVHRKEFAFEKWIDFDQELFDRIYNDESQEREFNFKCYGADINPAAIEIAEKNIRSAGLMKYIELSGILGGDGLKSFPKEVNKKELLLRASASPAVFNGLVDKHIFEVYQQEVGRLNSVLREILPINPLNEHQKMAYDEVVRSFQSKNVRLLHGVTASGKTEIYIHLIEETIRQGKQVFMMTAISVRLLSNTA